MDFSSDMMGMCNVARLGRHKPLCLKLVPIGNILRGNVVSRVRRCCAKQQKRLIVRINR